MEDLLIIDPQLSDYYPAYSEAFLFDLLNLFISQIPEPLQAITKAFHQKDSEHLHQG